MRNFILISLIIICVFFIWKASNADNLPHLNKTLPEYSYVIVTCEGGVFQTLNQYGAWENFQSTNNMFKFLITIDSVIFYNLNPSNKEGDDVYLISTVEVSKDKSIMSLKVDSIRSINTAIRPNIVFINKKTGFLTLHSFEGYRLIFKIVAIKESALPPLNPLEEKNTPKEN